MPGWPPLQNVPGAQSDRPELEGQQGSPNVPQGTQTFVLSQMLSLHGMPFPQQTSPTQPHSTGVKETGGWIGAGVGEGVGERVGEGVGEEFGRTSC